MKTKQEFSVNALAQLTGIDRRTIAKRLDGVKPARVANKAKYFAATDVLPLLKSMPAEVSEKRAAEVRKLKGQCERIELETEIRRGNFVRLETVKRELLRVCALAKSKLHTMENAAAAEAGLKLGLTNDQVSEIKTILIFHSRNIMREIHGSSWGKPSCPKCGEPL